LIAGIGRHFQVFQNVTLDLFRKQATLEAYQEITATYSKSGTMVKRGRKEKYRKDWPKRAKAMAAKGWMECDIARALGIHHTTFPGIKSKHPELQDAIDEGNREMCKGVVSAVIKTAKGYTATETTTEVDALGAVRSIKTTKKHIQPSQKAIEFILTNKSGGEWNRKKQVEHSGSVESVVRRGPPKLSFENMTPEKEPELSDYEDEKGKEDDQT